MQINAVENVQSILFQCVIRWINGLGPTAYPCGISIGFLLLFQPPYKELCLQMCIINGHNRIYVISFDRNTFMQ